VLVPLFTCTATNIPLLYIGAKPKFVDVDPRTLNLSIEDLKRKISDRTRAIVCVHYGGLPCDMADIRNLADQYGIPVIEDAAHALGATYDGMPIGSGSEFAMYSFQAIKHLTKREVEILRLVAEGLTNDEIGKRIFISEKTVKTHLTNIFDKLKVNNRFKAALLIMERASESVSQSQGWKGKGRAS